LRNPRDIEVCKERRKEKGKKQKMKTAIRYKRSGMELKMYRRFVFFGESSAMRFESEDMNFAAHKTCKVLT
jgi:hypothetical protein